MIAIDELRAERDRLQRIGTAWRDLDPAPKKARTAVPKRQTPAAVPAADLTDEEREIRDARAKLYRGRGAQSREVR